MLLKKRFAKENYEKYNDEVFFHIYFLIESIDKNSYLHRFSQKEVVRAQQKVYFFCTSAEVTWLPSAELSVFL